MSICLLFCIHTITYADSINLPAGLVEIKEEAFYGDTSITKVTVPEGTTTIGPKAFANSGLQKIILPESMNSIDSTAFDGLSDSFIIVAPRGSYSYQYAADNYYRWCDSTTKTEYMVINGKKYLAVYYGQQDISRWGECTYRDFWRLENAYDDFKNARLFGDNLPANNYVMPVEVGQVYVIDYYQKDGRAFREVMRCDGNLFDGQLSTHAVAVDAPIYTETMSIGGRKYNASYFGQWISPPFSPYVNRSFWRLENAYNDFKDNRFAGESLYERNYPMAIKAGQVYVIDYTLRSGGTDRKIMRNDGIIKDGMQQTYAIIVE